MSLTEPVKKASSFLGATLADDGNQRAAASAISDEAFDLIVACEVTSRKVYEQKYRRPEWPGLSSGITTSNSS